MSRDATVFVIVRVEPPSFAALSSPGAKLGNRKTASCSQWAAARTPEGPVFAAAEQAPADHDGFRKHQRLQFTFGIRRAAQSTRAAIAAATGLTDATASRPAASPHTRARRTTLAVARLVVPPYLHTALLHASQTAVAGGLCAAATLPAPTAELTQPFGLSGTKRAARNGQRDGL